VAGTVSTGGLAALSVKVFRKKNHVTEIISDTNQKRDENANTHSR